METLLALCLILQLGNEDYQTREAAHLKLAKAPPAALLRWGEKSAGAEVAARCASLLDGWAAAAATKLKPTTYPALPWIDSLPHGYPDRAGIVNTYAQFAEGDSSPPSWEKYRHATLLWVKDRLRAGDAEGVIVADLDAMAEREKGWIAKAHHAYKFTAWQLKAAGLAP